MNREIYWKWIRRHNNNKTWVPQEDMCVTSESACNRTSYTQVSRRRKWLMHVSWCCGTAKDNGYNTGLKGEHNMTTIPTGQRLMYDMSIMRIHLWSRHSWRMNLWQDWFPIRKWHQINPSRWRKGTYYLRGRKFTFKQAQTATTVGDPAVRHLPSRLGSWHRRTM